MGREYNDTDIAAYIRKGKDTHPGKLFARRCSEAKTWKDFKSYSALVQA